MTDHTTREGWLLAAADLIRKRVFTTEDCEYAVPEFRVSVGWPKGRRSTSNVIGECFNTLWSEDGIPAIFISPVLKAELEILQCLVHEMIHALDDCQNGHRGHFAYVFKRIGMVGKRTETLAGDELLEILRTVASDLGAYPHGKMKKGVTAAAGPKKQTTRMLKVSCDCGCTIRMAKSWIEKGLPTCACGNEMKEV